MKAKTKILLTSLMSVAFASSLIAGSTYALFTSEAKTNIAVTSGKVNVTATIGEVKTTGLNGMAMVNVNVEGNSISLENVVPGDKVEFPITVENLSNVAIQYRTQITCTEDDGLMDGLVFKVNDEDYSGLISYVSEWAVWTEDDEETTKTIKTSIELPEDAGNEYQSKSAKISFAVEAVQGNATTDNSESGLKRTVKTSDFTEMKDALASSGNVVMTEDIKFDIDASNSGTKSKIAIGDGSSLDLGGHELYIANANGTGKEVLAPAGLNSSNMSTVTIKNGTIKLDKTYGSNGAIDGGCANLTLENVTIEVPGGYALSGSNANWKMTNCSFTGNITLGSQTVAELTNTTINGVLSTLTGAQVTMYGGKLSTGYKPSGIPSYLYGLRDNSGKFRAYGTTFGDGMFYTKCSNIILSNCIFVDEGDDNRATLYIAGGTTNLYNCTINEANITKTAGTLNIFDYEYAGD